MQAHMQRHAKKKTQQQHNDVPYMQQTKSDSVDA